MSDCKECAEYDNEKHYCPKYCDVIEHTLADKYQQGRADEKSALPRCKDCIHWQMLNLTQSHLCDVHNWMSKADDYCSFVELKEKE